VLSTEQLAAVEAVVSEAKGRFLPEWDDIEHHVNSGRGAAGEAVADLRRRLDAAHATLLRVLGSGYLSHANPESAVTALERALELSPDDESVARSLVAACLQTGRLSRAEAIKKDFALV
jgi:Flp pilus assembly protein TadD